MEMFRIFIAFCLSLLLVFVFVFFLRAEPNRTDHPHWLLPRNENQLIWCKTNNCDHWVSPSLWCRCDKSSMVPIIDQFWWHCLRNSVGISPFLAFVFSECARVLDIFFYCQPEANSVHNDKLRSKPIRLDTTMLYLFCRSRPFISFAFFLHCGANVSFPYGAIGFAGIFFFVFFFFFVRNGICMWWAATTNNSTLAPPPSAFVCTFTIASAAERISFENFHIRCTRECSTMTTLNHSVVVREQRKAL